MVGEGLAPPETRLRPCGKIAEDQLHFLERRYSNVSVDRYVIMPDHIHMIVIVRPFGDENGEKDEGDGTSRAPSPTNATIPRVVASLKRLCHAELGESIFQRSYIDHIIRDRADYEQRVRYIDENPLRWYYTEQSER